MNTNSGPSGASRRRLNAPALGARGEAIAARYLKRRGYRLMERNWRYQKNEIDLIALKKGQLVFFEIKTATGLHPHDLRARLRRNQERRIRRAAQAYLRTLAPDRRQHRFDVLLINYPLEGSPKPEILHIEGAIFAQ